MQTPAVASRMNNRARTWRTDGKGTKKMTFSEAEGGGGERAAQIPRVSVIFGEEIEELCDASRLRAAARSSADAPLV